MREVLKPIVWLGDSLDRVRAFSQPARQQDGYELETIQHGMEPSDWKPMPTIGAGVREIRIHASAEHRVFYVARFERSIYVLHAFVKKTPKTPKSAIRLGMSRYREALRREGMA
ncbi:MAG TPA: type II toxin-antitoxin system RelE/ParE family toxin [Bryobacteraceae bacterium]|nr:type II toxin-antitoxin system RelE/ParE family toxin [Bryobacteraceae bacterium]